MARSHESVRFRRVSVMAAGVAAMSVVLLAESFLPYPLARKDDVVDNYHGTSVADPYRWMEDLNSPELQKWVAVENALTFKYLESLPERVRFQQRITELWNYPRVSVPTFEGGSWFYARNSGLLRQAVIYRRWSLGGPDFLVLDPNALSRDGSIALSAFEPSPDGRHFAYGLSEGGSDWSTYYVRELATAKQLPDTIRWVKFSSLAWSKDGKGFFYGRYPEPPAGQALQAAIRDKKIFYHLLGTPQTADRLIYERADEPMLYIDFGLDETGRYLFVETNKGTSNKNELFVKDLGTPKAPHFEAPVAPLYPGHTAQYQPMGVVNGMLYLLTDREAPKKKVVAVPIAQPDVAGWKTIVPESEHSIESASLVAGRVAINRLEDVASAPVAVPARRWNTDKGCDACTWSGPRAYGTVRSVRSILRIHLAAFTNDGISPRRLIGKECGVRHAKAHLRRGSVRNRADLFLVEGRHARSDVRHPPEGHQEGWLESNSDVRLRRLRHR